MPSEARNPPPSSLLTPLTTANNSSQNHALLRADILIQAMIPLEPQPCPPGHSKSTTSRGAVLNLPCWTSRMSTATPIHLAVLTSDAGIQPLHPTSSSKTPTILQAHHPPLSSIPAIVHTPSHSCALLQPLFEYKPLQSTHLTHLPCSILSNPTPPPPTLLELKPHTEALHLVKLRPRKPDHSTR